MSFLVRLFQAPAPIAAFAARLLRPRAWHAALRRVSWSLLIALLLQLAVAGVGTAILAASRQALSAPEPAGVSAAQVIRERASMMRKVRALSSEGRMTATMLTALPILAFTLLFIGNPKFYLDVADDPAFLPGYVVLLTLYAIGFFTIRRMIDLKV